MVMPLLIVAFFSLTVVLQFDGSLRPPRDPMPGFNYSPCAFGSDSTKQLVGSEKLASCSAAISILSINDNEHTERLIAIGGKYLPNFPGMTSADTEYEGLLLGLEWLVSAVSSERELGSNVSVLPGLSNGEHQVAHSKLIIRGDCKTIIDQLNSRSVPRKMESNYNFATARIESLKEMYADHQHQITCGTAQGSIPQELSLCFEHVPRENNFFCDALCKLVINQKQAAIVKSIQDLILLGEDDVTKRKKCDHHLDYSTNSNSMKKRKKKINRLPRSIFFQQALDNIRHTSQLCHSSRLALACELTKVSMRHKDSLILNDISDFFLIMSRRWPRIYYETNSNDSVGRYTLKKVSVACKTEKLPTSSSDVNQEHGKTCLDEIESIFEFCANSKAMVHHQEELGPSNFCVLDPYLEISELISGVSVESQKNKLRSWNEVAAECQQGKGRSIDSYIGTWNKFY